MPTITFGHGDAADAGFLHQVDYDDHDWSFGTFTPTQFTGPDQDYTGDTDGLFAYVEGECCEGERVCIKYTAEVVLVTVLQYIQPFHCHYMYISLLMIKF